MGRILNSDELGTVGESIFQVLCARAQLVCNKSDRDRTGWDFVVEFPMADLAPGVTLDNRLPIVCGVQLKSTTSGEGVKLRLSAADRLAKDLRPTFIVVLRLSPDGEMENARLIHLLDAPLAKVLKRLRMAHATGKVDINHATISFEPRRFGQRVALTPEGLREALAGACGPDRDAYTARKQHQLAALGYEDGGLAAEMTIFAESVDHMSDILLGLAPFRAHDVVAFDTRFNVPLPYDGPLLAELQEEMEFEPPLAGACTVSIIAPGFASAARFEADLVPGPPLGGADRVWMLVRHADFTIKFRDQSAHFESTGDFPAQHRTLADWIVLTRALANLNTPGAKLIVMPRGVVDAALTLPLNGDLNGPYVDQMPVIAKILARWGELAERAGVHASKPFFIEDVWINRPGQLAQDLMFEAEPHAWLGIANANIGDQDDRYEAIYVNSCQVGGAALSYGLKVVFERRADDPTEHQSVVFTPIDARPEVADLQDYAEELGLAHDVNVLVNPANMVEVDASERPARVSARD